MDARRIPRSTIELPPLQQLANDNTNGDLYSYSNSARLPTSLMESILNKSPPERSSTLPPLQRPLGLNRSRKHSVTKRARELQHKKKVSRGSGEWMHRIQSDENIGQFANDRKAQSAEPSADYGKRWEELLDAAEAASAAGDLDDRTPVSLHPVATIHSSPPEVAPRETD